MIVLLTLVWWSSCGSATAVDPPGGYYTTRYDHLDVDNILNQKRLVQYYSACLLDRGPCTPQGLEFKRILPEAIKTNCLRCTEKQRVVTLRSIRRLKKQYPDVWAELAAAWDPTGEYVKLLEESYDRAYPPRSPTSLPPTINALFGDRFGGIGDDSVTTTAAPSITKAVSTTTVLTTTTSTPATTTTTSTTPATTTSTTSRPTTKTVVTSTKTATRPSGGVKPFSSIGVNLIVPNPVKLINAITNSVKYKTGMLLDTVNHVLRG